MKTANEAQLEHWNGEESAHWVEKQDRYDAMLAPFVDVILGAAELSAASRVLDVGCGCGATSLAAANAAPDGRVRGIDLSQPMLERARARAANQGVGNVEFAQADAQLLDDPTSFDAVISRFGVMFFDDPVAAFAGMQRAAVPGGRLAFVCWRDRSFNEWLQVPGIALAPFAPPMPPAPPNAPGMMGLADADYVRGVLRDAGWKDVELRETQRTILFGGPGTIDDALDFLRTGTIGRTVLSSLDTDTTARALGAVRAAFEKHATANGVAMSSSVWTVTAIA